MAGEALPAERGATGHPGSARRRDSTPHQERLILPWQLWAPALGLAALLAAEIHLGASGVRAWAPYAVLLPLAAVGLWQLGRIRIAVEAGELLVDDARLPVRHIASAQPLSPEQKRQLLGPDAHPLAFVVQRPWVRGAVKVVLRDPNDPTPYWVISSRAPDHLVTALQAAQEATAETWGQDKP
ncbi:MAG: DUF3093 domain-containing protein [Micromonosporaceae bacterium]